MHPKHLNFIIERMAMHFNCNFCKIVLIYLFDNFVLIQPAYTCLYLPPDPVVFFLAGRLPGEALLDLKQLTLFGMICRLPGNILNRIAHQLLTYSSQSNKNWFANIRTLCYKYNLPHPINLLSEPPRKEMFKKILKAHITDYWQMHYRQHSKSLQDKYF